MESKRLPTAAAGKLLSNPLTTHFCGSDCRQRMMLIVCLMRESYQEPSDYVCDDDRFVSLVYGGRATRTTLLLMIEDKSSPSPRLHKKHIPIRSLGTKSMQKRSSMSEKNWHIQMYSEYRITELHMLSEKTNSEKNRIPDVQTKTKRYPSDYNHLSHDCILLVVDY